MIGTIFAEYGMVFDPSGYDADLLDIRRHYLDVGGWFAVLVEGERVIGTSGGVPREGVTCEIKRVYLLPGYRGRGYGRALVEYILTRATEAGCREVVAWSDVRLTLAHQVYERLGFERFGARTTEDIERSREYGFRKRLDSA